jgi:hypothetical protein
MDLKIKEVGQLEIICDKKFSHKFKLSNKKEIEVKNDMISRIILMDLQRLGIVDYLNNKVIFDSNTFTKLSISNTKVVYFFLGGSSYAEAFVEKKINSVKSEVLLLTPDGIKRAVGYQSEDAVGVRVIGQPEAYRFAREAIY